jgi:capsular polysaccharide biosynthesis protein
MTFQEFVKLIQEKYWLIIICLVVVLAGVFWFNLRIEKTYEGNIGFSIVRFGVTGKSEFDDYYATQADNLVTANFVKWLDSKPFLAAVYERAGRNLDGENLNKLVKKTDVQKVSGTDISISFETTGKEATLKLGQAMIDEISARNHQIQKSASKNPNLRGLMVSSKLTVHQKSTNQLLNYLLGLAGGILLGLIFVLIIRYFRSGIKS